MVWDRQTVTDEWCGTDRPVTDEWCGTDRLVTDEWCGTDWFCHSGCR